MALSSPDFYIRQNPPIPVCFAGWRSTTHELGYNGWEIAAFENWQQDFIHFVFRHKELGMVGEGRLDSYRHQRDKYIRPMDFGATQYGNKGFTGFEPIYVNAMGSEKSVIISSSLDSMDYTKHRHINTVPTATYIRRESIRLSEIPLFIEVGKSEAQELIVNPEDVQMILDKVLMAQASGMKDIRARDSKREKQEEREVHAQIITLKRAA